MFDFISQTPPESALLLGLTTGALLSDLIKRVAAQRVKQATGVTDE